MAKIKLQATLKQRLAMLAKMRDAGLQEYESSDPKNPSFKLAVLLRYRVHKQLEQWLEDNKDADATDIANAVLAVCNSVMEAGLRLASANAEHRGAIAGRYLNQFLGNAIDSGLITMPQRPLSPQQDIAENAISRSLIGPDGKPLKVQ